MQRAGTVPSDLAGVTLTLQSHAQKPSGHGFIDSEPETVTIY
jgi:hypothetical protein